MTTSPTPPKLRRLRFHVWTAPEGSDAAAVDDSAVEYALVMVTHADQLKAELMAAQRKVDMRTQPMALTSLWLWCSMARAGQVADKYDTWRNRLVSYDPVDDLDDLDDDEDSEADAHPTGASTSSD